MNINLTPDILILIGCSPNKLTPLNIALPFSFIDFYRKTKGKDVGSAINKYGNRDIRWVSHGMLRIDVSIMKDLFEVQKRDNLIELVPTIDKQIC